MSGGARMGQRGRWAEDQLAVAFAECPGSTVVKTTAPVRVVRFLRGGGRGGARFEGFFERPGTCDFEGGFMGRHVCIEAKRWSPASTPRWRFKSVIAEHQLERMGRVEKDGGIAGVILLVDDDKAIQTDPPRWFWISYRLIRNLMAYNGQVSLSVDEVYACDLIEDRLMAPIKSGPFGTRPQVEPILRMLMV